ncbi:MULTISPECIES: hypothetical protein [Acinetobacter]|uniref:hypothetical protein n=1 Tax=Acinetobacter TaxID=469 RepID=UPI00055437E8|nr:MULTISPECIES: hypothetical protein [Acinetobacter]MCK4089830.1 hypothetical protein [Acinetobacter radioresistens]MCU4309529.1 hypothetical protein [Acinetobacter radioresistens]MCU4501243.1 hypothetical protein [Acinetobacter radioresistens]MCU4518469.1 hypothetical protein [Acinetobacter radioresistens]MCX0343602.1 hypothetical protein [Acinetobacter radioresistens]
MKAETEGELLRSIYQEMQELKQSLASQDESRVSTKEFAKRLGMSEPTLWDRVKDGIIKEPERDGRRVFWLNSYVNYAVRNCKKPAIVAA